MSKLVNAMPLAFDNELYYSRADKLKNQLAAKQKEGSKLLLKMQRQKDKPNDYLSRRLQFVAMNGDELHSEESFDALVGREEYLVRLSMS